LPDADGQGDVESEEAAQLGEPVPGEPAAAKSRRRALETTPGA
jgi:hypothetical protein